MTLNIYYTMFLYNKWQIQQLTDTKKVAKYINGDKSGNPLNFLNKLRRLSLRWPD